VNAVRSFLDVPDEHSHPEYSLEWWFIHGCYSGVGIAQTSFMASIFRHTVSRNSTSTENGFSFILSQLDHEKGITETLTRIDHRFLDYFISLRSKLDSWNLNNRFLELFFNELKKNGPPRGILLSESEVVLRSSPFLVRWEDFSLAQAAGDFTLQFTSPHSQQNIEFTLQPENKRIFIEDTFHVGGKERGMMYYSYPRLALAGTVDGQKVSGTAWFDHQWGNSALLLESKSKKQVLGWDWFGINFENGSDWVVGVHRNFQSRRAFSKYIYIRDKSDEVHRFYNFRVKPLRFWQSPKTYIRHPVEWKIEVPEIQAQLVFKPFQDNQEIPVLGFMRAIWEGAGVVTGRIGTEAVSGYARGEFQGYGYILDSEDHFKNISLRVDKHLQDFCPKTINRTTAKKYTGSSTGSEISSAFTEVFSKPIWDLIDRQGKKWRPIFSLLLLDTLGANIIHYEGLISVLAELTHTGSLIIDDIEDTSLLRRGDQCIHLKYGRNVAINAANTLYFLPLLKLIDHPHLSESQRLAIHEVTIKQFVKAHFGQALDIFWAGRMNAKNLENWIEDSMGQKILQMYEHKSASIIEALVESTVIMADSSKEIRTACLRFARAFGVAFQIMDDVYNFSDSSNWRKVCGEDICDNKLTYVLYRALTHIEGARRKRLVTILTSKTLSQQPEVLTEGVEIVRESGVLKMCRKKAHAIAEPSLMEMSRMLPFTESKVLLLTLCHNLLDLDLGV
jgi:geranylgeranyl pyrophosphate synthase/predicted secreted hydrolase